MKPQIYKRLKTIFKTEENALGDICRAKGIKENQLKACHEEKCFAWELIEETTTGTTNQSTFAKGDFTKPEAVKEAVKQLDTFEGNIKENHTETHYVFSKVR